MAKKKKLSRIRITDSVSKKLDLIADVDSTDVYKPKKEFNQDLEFLELIGEGEFSTSGDALHKGSKKLKVIDIAVISIIVITIIGIIIAFIKIKG